MHSGAYANPKAEILLLKEEIKDLEQRRKMLNEFLREYKVSKGGQISNKPSEQYNNFNNSYGNSYGNLYGNQYVNPYVNPYDPNINKNIVYLPNQGYQSPYQNFYYNQKYRVPYNVSLNKAKDQKSLLSFYITIELELFPGKSANMLQKSIVKCQSTFERIREAWADIFGFEYRPAPMNEAYSYNVITKKNNNSKKNRSEKKNTSRKQK